MVLPSFSFTPLTLGKFLFLMAIASIVGCQTGRKDPTRPQQVPISVHPSTSVAPAPTPLSPPTLKEFGTDADIPVPAPERVEPTPRPQREKPKLAIILGPGGIRGYAHAGVIQEIHRSKIPIVAIGGLEIGALAAAIYANKPQGFEAEWQMMKLKEEDFQKRSLIGGSQVKDLHEWTDFFASIFGTSRIEDSRIPYGCITVSVDKQNVLVMNKGAYSQAMPYCLAFPPLFRLYDKHMAGTAQLGALARYFKQKGATHILYVDVLSDKAHPILNSSNEASAAAWSVVSTAIEAQFSHVQDVLKIPISEEITAFARRRDMIQRGREAAAKALPSIFQKMGIEL